MLDRDHVTDTLLAISPTESALEVQNRLFFQLYDNLREMAASLLRRERAAQTLQPTALVHEAYLRLVDPERIPWEGRAHFLGAAARAMRRILVDHARRKLAAKRPPARQKVSLHEEMLPLRDPEIDLIVFDDLLNSLARLDERMSRIVELRAFGGLERAEIALVLGVSPRTVDGDWAMAKKWLRQELG
jgi:RNA polymerase sigma factor (TIGR02999 family)